MVIHETGTGHSPPQLARGRATVERAGSSQENGRHVKGWTLSTRLTYLEGHDLGLDEAALKVLVDHAGGLRGLAALLDGPGAHLGVAGGEVPGAGSRAHGRGGQRAKVSTVVANASRKRCVNDSSKTTPNGANQRPKTNGPNPPTVDAQLKRELGGRMSHVWMSHMGWVMYG